MKTILGIAAMLLIAITGYGQVKPSGRKMFADTEPIIKQYRVEAQKAWDADNEPLALAYSDSVRYSIIDTYVDNHTFITLNKKEVVLGEVKKPIMLIASASWCQPCIAEIPALNRMVEEYADKIAFIIIFQDTLGDKLTKLAAKYDRKMLLVPAEKEEEEISTLLIAGFKHYIGYPTIYFIDIQKRIIDYAQGAAVPGEHLDAEGRTVITTPEQANTINYQRLKGHAEALLSSN